MRQAFFTILSFLTFFSTLSLSAPVEIEKLKDFEKLQKSGAEFIVLDFTATWCEPCQKLKPIIKELADTGPDSNSKYKKFKNKVKFAVADYDKNPELVKKYFGKEESIPRLIFLRKVENEWQVDQVVADLDRDAAKAKKQITDALDSSIQLNSAESKPHAPGARTKEKASHR